jgi:Transposase IS116/IS110/IS902 family
VGLRQLDRLTGELDPLRAELARFSRRQPGCRALRTTHFGIGPITSVAIWAEMGDTRRFSSSDDAVRHTGLDITVYASDRKRAGGHLARQGPATLRWALYEAAVCATRPNSPDHAYFLAVKRRADGHLGVISVAQAGPAGPPHPARPRRSGLPAGAGGLTVGLRVRSRPRADALRPAPPVCLPASGPRHRLLDSLTRLMRPHPVGTTRSTITSPEATASEHQGKAGRSHAGAIVIAGMPEREVAGHVR